jgi:hypothetical protein
MLRSGFLAIALGALMALAPACSSSDGGGAGTGGGADGGGGAGSTGADGGSGGGDAGSSTSCGNESARVACTYITSAGYKLCLEASGSAFADPATASAYRSANCTAQSQPVAACPTTGEYGRCLSDCGTPNVTAIYTYDPGGGAQIKSGCANWEGP